MNQHISREQVARLPLLERYLVDAPSAIVPTMTDYLDTTDSYEGEKEVNLDRVQQALALDSLTTGLFFLFAGLEMLAETNGESTQGLLLLMTVLAFFNHFVFAPQVFLTLDKKLHGEAS